MSTADVPNPSGTLMFVIVSIFIGMIAVNLGVPFLWVLNAVTAIVMATVLIVALRIVWGV